MKEKNIIHYTRNSLPKGKTNIDRLRNISDEEIAAKEDKENPLWTKKMLNSAILHMPKKKVEVHMYVDEDIIHWFKSKGRGYQTRINTVLKSYVHEESSRNKI